ncbi:MAG: hypothetical protein ISS48_02385 [Candidatus Aenigmarchaeota archaeon]|nr:hypothetical protein [Candidatus Aenigmarchaeota archaeon]
MNIFGKISKRKNEIIDLYRRQPEENKILIGGAILGGLTLAYLIYTLAAQGFPETFEYAPGTIRW